MQRTTSRSALRRERIARQFRQTHDDVTTIFSRRLTTLFRSLSGSILESLSRADSPAIPVDQLFDAAQWGPVFNSILKPSLRTAAVTGISFEKEWTESATGETTRQHIASVANYVRNATRDASFKGVLCTSDQKLQLIRESQNLLEFSEDFSSFKAQKSPQPSLPGFLPDIGVDMSAELLAETERFLKFRTVGVWSKVSTTIRSQLQTAIQMGLRSGDNLQDLTKRIQSVLTLHSKYAAQRIARTETTAAMGFGGHAERLEIGTPAKEWVSTIDKRNRGANPKSRFDHLTCSGQTVESANAFVISGEHLLYPGDITLGATGGNVIHCRCSAVGAWPKGQLAGAGWKPSGMPRAADPIMPGAMTPEQKISSDALATMDLFRSNSVIVKQLINRTVEAMKAAFDETEAIRKKLVDIPDGIRSAQKRYGTVAKDLSASEAKIQEMRRLKYPKADIDREIKHRNELEKLQQQADDALSQATLDVEGQVQSILRAKNPIKIDIELDGVDGKSDEAFAARTAARWVGRMTDEKAVGTKNIKLEVESGVDRSYFKNKKMFLREKSGTETSVHELGHFLETFKDNGDIGKGFLLHRTEGYGGAKLMNKLDSGFHAGEAYWDDEFVKTFGSKIRAAYAGKFYAGQNHTEIISLGMELLHSNPIQFALRDPEYFRFIIGVLRGLL